MATYSAGLLNVNTLTATGTSASIKATKVNVTTLNATNVTADNLDFKNLTVSGTFDITGVNKYTSDYNAGDMIGYNVIGHFDASSCVYYCKDTYNFLIAPPDPSANVPITGMTVYELIYWGNDARVGDDLSRMSATLLIPDNLTDPDVLVSYKHGTISTTLNNSTMWYGLQNYAITGNNYFNQGTIFFDLSAFLGGVAGYVTVCADNPGYGRSSGNYDYYNMLTEVNSQYNATLAAKQFLQYNNLSIPTKVITGGYSLGGNLGFNVTRLIEADPSNNLHVINTLSGGPTNAYQINSVINKQPQLPVSWYVAFLFLLIQNNTVVQTKITLPNIYTDVNPISDQFYVNQINDGALLPKQLSNNVYYSNIYNGGDPENVVEPNESEGVLGYVYPDVLFDIEQQKNYLNFFLTYSFYTNHLIDYTPVSNGKTPVNIIYSLYDELCCYDPNSAINNDPYGNPEYDNVKYYARVFATDESVDIGKVTNPWCLGLYGNTAGSNDSLKLKLIKDAASEYIPDSSQNYVEYNPVYNIDDAFYQTEVKKLIASERIGFSSNTGVDIPEPLRPIAGTHYSFLLNVFDPITYFYLLQRTT